ncbi:TspO/MBR family protein [uncultured Devosia sp.]|uniref:TspO/MBR family protein n=1 Tax=uncultured Devosia sp. TaxID=211434 RepID=UPI0035C9B628
MPTASLADYKSPRPWLILAAFMVVVVGVGGLIGTQSLPGAWYQTLAKPPFNPPNWIFGPVWFALYVMIAIAGWRIFMIDAASTTMKIWYAQMLFNWAWSPVWFIAHQIWAAYAIIMVLWLLLIAFIVTARRIDKPAAWLFGPYLAWVSFASLLNLSIGILN